MVAPSEVRRRTRRRGRRRLWLLLLLPLGVLLTAELTLRIARPYNESLRRLLYLPGATDDLASVASLPELMDRTIVGYRPGTKLNDFVLNSRSLRTREYLEAAPPDTFRVLALGDSFTWASGGVPFDSLWHRRLEQRLAGERGSAVEVLALGVPGIGTDFELRMFQLEGARLGADLVVLAFFVGNDFSDVVPYVFDRTVSDAVARRSLAVRGLRNLWRLRGLSDDAAPAGAGGPRSGADEALELGPLRPDDLPSAAVAGDDGEVMGREFLGRWLGIPGYEPTTPSFDEQEFLEVEARRMQVCQRENPRFDLCRARVLELLEALDHAVTEAGARWVLMIIPDEFQVDGRVRERALAHAEYDAQEFDWERPQRLLSSFCASRGIACLDLLPAFAERARRGPLYRVRNTHWNVQGNQLAAELLATFVVEQGLLDAR